MRTGARTAAILSTDQKSGRRVAHRKIYPKFITVEVLQGTRGNDKSGYGQEQSPGANGSEPKTSIIVRIHHKEQQRTGKHEVQGVQKGTAKPRSFKKTKECTEILIMNLTMASNKLGAR